MKKRLIVFICVLMVISIPIVSFADPFRVGDEAVYEGIPGYANLKRNISFKDVQSSWGKSSIYKLSALGIMEGSKLKFNPEALITKKEALETIGKSLGIHTNQKKYMKTLMKAGVLSKEEEKRLKKERSNYATREEIAVWIGRSLKLKGKTPYLVRSFKDSSSFREETTPIVEAAICEGIMTGYQDGYFKPTGFITRQEFARALDNGLDKILLKRGYRIKAGEIKDMKVLAITERNTPVVKNIYYIKNKDGSYPIICTSKSSQFSLNKGFIIYRGGKKPTDSNTLRKFDYLKYYVNDRNQVVYGEIKPLI